MNKSILKINLIINLFLLNLFDNEYEKSYNYKQTTLLNWKIIVIFISMDLILNISWNNYIYTEIHNN
jgi:hypothetical protein